jgi:hypothetical protein
MMMLRSRWWLPLALLLLLLVRLLLPLLSHRLLVVLSTMVGSLQVVTHRLILHPLMLMPNIQLLLLLQWRLLRSFLWRNLFRLPLRRLILQMVKDPGCQLLESGVEWSRLPTAALIRTSTQTR